MYIGSLKDVDVQGARYVVVVAGSIELLELDALFLVAERKDQQQVLTHKSHLK
jgi:diphthamide biosynthesis methyltransferase